MKHFCALGGIAADAAEGDVFHRCNADVVDDVLPGLLSRSLSPKLTAAVDAAFITR